MKFRIIHNFPWPAEKIRAMLSTGEDIVPMEKLPNVSQRKQIDFKRNGSKFVRRMEWCVHGQIPPIAQKIVRPEMLTFIEESVWDDNEGSFTTSIKPHFLKESLKCTSVSKWIDAGNGKTRREYDGAIEVRLPIIGPILEKTITEYLRKNTEQNAVMVTEALREKLGPPNS